MKQNTPCSFASSHSRISAERIVSGSGLYFLHQWLARKAIAKKPFGERNMPSKDDVKKLWTEALASQDEGSSGAVALDRFMRCLGTVTGDVALAQGPDAIVTAGGQGSRIKDQLPDSGFVKRFMAKGHRQVIMERIPVKHCLHEEPGLYGAATAFIQQYRENES